MALHAKAYSKNLKIFDDYLFLIKKFLLKKEELLKQKKQNRINNKPIMVEVIDSKNIKRKEK